MTGERPHLLPGVDSVEELEDIRGIVDGDTECRAISSQASFAPNLCANRTILLAAGERRRRRAPTHAARRPAGPQSSPPSVQGYAK